MSSPRENTNVSTSSSKAVLAALRALQDKIARLELEKTHAMDETAQLRHQLQNQEIEFEHMKNKDSLTSQKALQEARHAYDRLLTDKTELEIRIARLEERNAENRGNTDLLQHKIREVEEEKYQCQLQAKELETEQLQLNLQIDHGHKREKGKCEDILTSVR
jgi:chromosome segregation ATPase